MNRIKLRENTFKLLYCKEFHDTEDMPKQYELLFDEEPVISDEDKEYITGRVDDIVAHQEYIDKEIKAS